MMRLNWIEKGRKVDVQTNIKDIEDTSEIAQAVLMAIMRREGQ
jgi:hypothetical protein